MDKIDITTERNKIGISIKRPDGEYNKKWSEAFADIQCEDCKSKNIESDKQGEFSVLICLECSNHWYGNAGRLFQYDKDELAKLKISSTTFEVVDDRRLLNVY